MVGNETFRKARGSAGYSLATPVVGWHHALGGLGRGQLHLLVKIYFSYIVLNHPDGRPSPTTVPHCFSTGFC